MSSTNDFARTLKALHKPGQPLIVPNVWDTPSLLALSSLNTPSDHPVAAIATASWALAHARGAADEDLTAEQNLLALRELAPLAAGAGLPLSADLQDGYGARIEEIFTTAAQYGIAGANLEDSIPAAGFGRGFAGSLYSKADAVARIQTALRATAAAGVPDFVINARCDVFRLDVAPELDDATRMREALDRGRAYLAAGATTVFFWGGGARGLSTHEVQTLVAELDGRVAVLLTKRDGGHSTAELAKMGVARISIGPSLYLAAMNAVKTGAAQILGGGGLLASPDRALGVPRPWHLYPPRLEQALEKLSTSPSPSCSFDPGATSRDGRSASVLPVAAATQRTWTDSTGFVERDPSFERQSYLASQIAELAHPASAESSEVADQLKTLSDVSSAPARSNTSRSTALAGPRADPVLKREQVPSSFVLKIIRYLESRVKNGAKPLLLIVHPIPDLDLLKNLCQNVYFPLDPMTVGQLTLFNALLYFAIWEVQSRGDSEIDAEDLAKYRQVTDANFNQGVEEAEIIAIANYENALTLCLAAYYAHTIGDIVRHQAVVSAAARHCVQLGYHRNDKGQLSPEESHKRRLLFWHVYISELGLTLRLGRAAVIQEFDVDVPQLNISSDPRQAVWDTSLRLFTGFSRLQSKIYRKIYSPGAIVALAAEPSKRQARVATFAAELNQWYMEWHQIKSADAYYPMVHQHTFMAVDIIYYSVLTLLHRGSTSSNSPSDISPECFAAARQGLETHLHIFPSVLASGPGTVSYYGVWIFMYSSFTPYIVTFLHSIASTDTNDLQLLKSVLDTLDDIAIGYELVHRQKTLCAALYRIAKAFIESRQRLHNNGNHNGDEQSAMDHEPFATTAEQTLNLPLQPDTIQEWGNFDTIVEDWETQYFNQQSLMLGNSLDQ
ncbi:C6 transcription factor [Cordyceps militaris CM01]|uniref:C6 transcription factor n=1 Tax=Cordyceps militaris (strain CM01) TaxID=983644 RepID=G3JLW6_CORMM|nr:C6 transcription factor [Cordyceps militaris CM01]EGX90690.1 C6 transcription factor [Cordyceps militaris CM01]